MDDLINDYYTILISIPLPPFKMKIFSLAQGGTKKENQKETKRKKIIVKIKMYKIINLI